MIYVLAIGALYATPILFGALALLDWLKQRHESRAWMRNLRAQTLANRRKYEPRACEARGHDH